ncbi:MAG: hypothetical protein PHE02_03465 [Lachnospiraceae bacterium]|nr:hypothetical protein [Lachnospiraceae bacterium]
MTLSALISGICWTVTYFCLVYRGFKDKSYGMPMVALALNFAWEVTFSFIFPPSNSGIALTIINIIWCLLDMGIVITLLKNGYQYFKEEYTFSQNIFYIFFALALLLSFGIMITGATFFAPFDYFLGDTFESAKFIAMIQNAVMSILFVRMFYARKKNGHPIEGQSFYVALTKMIGTSFTVGLTSITDHPDNWKFIAVVEVTCIIFDIWYTIVIWRELKSNHINPLKRL